tara:strand:- start:227 stop:1063 length:837 start_codon:yes stop_codon:yes gene_type:complete
VKLILGTAQLVQPYGVLGNSYGPREGAAPSILKAAVVGGFSALDTAPIYGDAEATIGSIDHGLGLHTKIRHGSDSVESVKQSLAALATSRLDVVYLHQEYTGSAHQLDSLQHLSDHMGAKINSLGASLYSLEELYRVLESPLLTSVQIPLNVLDRRFTNEVLSLAKQEGITVYARSIFLQGLLLAAASALPANLLSLAPFIQQFHAVAARHGLTPLEATLGFAKSFGSLDGLVVGAHSAENVGEISRAFFQDYSQEFVEECFGIKTPPGHLTDPRNWM